MNNLPDELLELIFIRLGLRDLYHTSLTNKLHQQIIDREQLILKKKIEDFPNLLMIKGIDEFEEKTFEDLKTLTHYKMTYLEKNNKLIFTFFDDKVEIDTNGNPYKIYININNNEHFQIVVLCYNKLYYFGITSDPQAMIQFFKRSFDVPDQVSKIYKLTNLHSFYLFLPNNEIEIIHYEIDNKFMQNCTISKSRLVYVAYNHFVHINEEKRIGEIILVTDATDNDNDAKYEGLVALVSCSIVMIFAKYNFDTNRWELAETDYSMMTSLDETFDDELFEKSSRFIKTFDINNIADNYEFFKDVAENIQKVTY